MSDLSDADRRILNKAKATVGRHMEVAKAGAAVSGKGPAAVKAAMRKKYIEQRGGGSTLRPGYDYSLGGSAAADKEYL